MISINGIGGGISGKEGAGSRGEWRKGMDLKMNPDFRFVRINGSDYNGIIAYL